MTKAQIHQVLTSEIKLTAKDRPETWWASLVQAENYLIDSWRAEGVSVAIDSYDMWEGVKG